MRIILPKTLTVCGSPIEVEVSEDGKRKDAMCLNGVPLLRELLITVNHTYCEGKVASGDIALLAGGLQKVLDKYEISFAR